MDTTNKPRAWLEPTTGAVMPDTDYQNNPFANETGDWIPLYTHPNEHDLGIAEAIGFDRGYQAATARSQESDSYGDGTVYRGVRSKDSEVKTYVFDEHAGKQTWSIPAKTPTDDFIYKNHMGYVSPAGAFYAPDYPTWKQDGLTPVYREPTVEELTDEQILCLWDWWSGEDLATNVLDFADTYRRALLGEAGLVKWHQAYVKKMNEQDPAWKATEQYKCNGFCGEYECRENKSKCKRKATQE